MSGRRARHAGHAWGVPPPVRLRRIAYAASPAWQCKQAADIGALRDRRGEDRPSRRLRALPHVGYEAGLPVIAASAHRPGGQLVPRGTTMTVVTTAHGE